ncbi:MAG: hypothetical protein ACOX6T_18105 [Myxococcales bacterium]
MIERTALDPYDQDRNVCESALSAKNQTGGENAPSLVCALLLDGAARDP